jgi:hypothetical protein
MRYEQEAQLGAVVVSQKERVCLRLYVVPDIQVCVICVYLAESQPIVWLS